MSDKLKGDAGIRLQKEIAMGRSVAVPKASIKLAKGGSVDKTQYQKYGMGLRKVKAK